MLLPLSSSKAASSIKVPLGTYSSHLPTVPSEMDMPALILKNGPDILQLEWHQLLLLPLHPCKMLFPGEFISDFILCLV